MQNKDKYYPGGLKNYLQSFDIFITKLFKDELKKRYTKYCIDQKDTNARISKNIWYIRLERFGMIINCPL